VTDHYFDICCHGTQWCYCGCDDPGFDDEPEDGVCEYCGGELDCACGICWACHARGVAGP
jgi:hypothetical protein